MISLDVTQYMIDIAKQQVEEFKKIPQGKWRYTGVEAWRGVVCEMVCSNWIKEYYDVQQEAKGLDTSGVYDECDMIVSGYKVEIKSATKMYFKSIMPKVYDITHKPKDLYVGCKYDETSTPNRVLIIGWMTYDEVCKYPVRQNKGAPYYDIPLADLHPFKYDTP